MNKKSPKRAEGADEEPFGSRSPGKVLSMLIAATRRMPNNWLGRRIAFALRRIGLGMLAGGPADVEAFGARFRLCPFDNVCERRILFTPQYFDPVERALLDERIGENFVFVDIGANVGGYSLFVATRAGPTARVLAIEPQPIIFERLVRNIRENPVGTIKAMQCAVADREGELTLFIDRRNRGESSIKYLRPENQAGGQALVPARTLHAILLEERLDHIDALKLDIEGSEDLALEPFFRTAPRQLWPGIIIIERLESSLPPELSRLLEFAGYRPIATTKLNVVLERRAVPASQLVDSVENGDNQAGAESPHTAQFAAGAAS